MAAEVEFRAPVDGGEIVGWRRPGDGPPILLLHGGPGLSEYLESLADELDGLGSIARYQQRGLEPSIASGDRSVEGHVADAVAVLDALGWEQAVIVGHSWGGHLAMHFGVAHPQRVLGLVILDPLGAAGDGGFAEFPGNLRSRLGAEVIARLDELDAIEEPNEEDHRKNLALLWPAYFGDPASASPMPFMRFDMNAAETWTSILAHFEARTLERGLPNFTKPFLLIHGERSPIPLAEGRASAALVPGGRLVVHPGKGHWAWVEEPGFVRGRVAEWLTSAPSDSPRE